VPADVEALVRSFRARVVVALVDPQDVAAAGAPGWRERDLTRGLEALRRDAGRLRFGVLAPPCAIGQAPAVRARFVRALERWTTRTRVRLEPADPEPCASIDSPGSPATAIWHAVADAARAR
jgi:hypothetical protein